MKVKNPMAFPKDGNEDEWGRTEGAQSGMTLRDWFAGQALAGAATDTEAEWRDADRAEWCYKMADAMLEARAK